MPQIVLAATQAAALAPAVAPAVLAPAAAGIGSAAAQTTALELAKQKAIETSMQQMATEGAKQATAEAVKQQVGTEVAKQGIAQAGQQVGTEAAKQGIFSANPAGMPPTAGAPITPAGPAQPLPPAGGTPFTPAGNTATYNAVDTTQLKGLDAAKFDAVSGQTGVPQNAYVYTSPTTTPPPDPTAVANVAPDKLISQSAADAQASSQKVADVGTSFYDKPVVPEGIGAKPPEPNALQKGFETGLQYVKDKPIETGLLTMGIGQYMNKPEEEDEDKYKNTVDMSGFQPSTPTQRPFTRSYEYQNYAVGGPVEQMAAQNAVGANTGYPMANLQTPMYVNPAMQRPEATNVIAPSADAGVGAYSGEQRFAEGGLSAAERREYGLRTRGQRAAQNLTKTFEEMEAERQREAMKLFGESSLPSPRPIARSRTQELSSPFSAAMAEHARLGKKAKVPVVQMPKTNLGDIDNYMDIPIEAANGGIMRYAKGGETQYGVTSNPNHVNPENYTRSELAGGRRPTAPTAPVMTAPKYTAPVQQKTYVPISYQQPQPQPQPQPQQQSDMSDFYSSMDQQLANYGFAEGGIMHGLGGYSDGGRLLKGPGDGVSDSIPAVIGKRQPARLADGEFVIPARIVSELGNGSTEAGARKLYAMMERVQASRKKSIGKKKVAVNSKADKHLPA